MAESQDYVPHNILVTGGAGFIASHMVIHLVNKYPQYNIVNLDKMDYCASTVYLQSLEGKSNYEFVKGDILSADLLLFVMRSRKIDTVMHFAAQSHVDNSFGNSIEFTRNNVLGTHVLVECAKTCGVKRFLHVSTDEVYGETAYKDGTLEEAILQPTNPYAASKAGAEHLVLSYHKSFKFPVVLTRSNNIFGPHQFPEKVIPKFICLLERKRACTLHGAGESKRSFLYVTDVVRAYDSILHKGRVGEVYNIGSPFEISMKDLAEKLISMYGYDKDQYLTFVKDRALNDLRYHIDGSKVNELGWKPEVSFEEGLKKTIEWYRSVDIDSVWDGAENALKPHPNVKSFVN